MKYSISVLFAIALLPALFVSNASATENAKTVGLTCQVERILEKENLQFSVVLDEKNRAATINGAIFKNSDFGAYKIEGKVSEPHHSVGGVNRVMEFSLDRLTGKFFFGTLTAVANGSVYTEQQKEQLALLGPEPVFVGTCLPSKPMF